MVLNSQHDVFAYLKITTKVTLYLHSLSQSDPKLAMKPLAIKSTLSSIFPYKTLFFNLLTIVHTDL